MCGITGIYQNSKDPINKELLESMAKALEHRGPDDGGIYIDAGVGLGNRRLSILDLSLRGHQPMLNSAGSVCITYNGELYNFKELRSELEKLGHVFVSDADTEVILKSYEQWGEPCLGKFNGMFAFAIWDKPRQQLFLARDRMGEKPLYYYSDGHKFVFASEIKSILEDKSIVRRVDSQGMVNYFTFGHSVGEDTMYQNIKKLLPGHSLTVKNGQVNIEKFWDSLVLQAGADRGGRYYQEKLLEIFDDSVKRRMVADVPLGVFLSGGLDSSSVVAMMARHTKLPITTFSVGFDEPGTEFNELKDAKVVSDYFKTRHHELILRESDLLETLQDIVYHFDEPFGDAANFPVFCVSRLASKHVKVVLTGEGADEIFGGYRRYMIENNFGILSVLKWIASNKIVASLVSTQPKLKKIRQLVSALAISDDLIRQTNWLVCFTPAQRQQLFAPGFLDKNTDPFKKYREYDARYRTSRSLEKMLYLDQKVLLPDGYLEKVDKASMAWGLETRTPFLDHRLVELANSMPGKYKIRGLETKYMFKKAMAPFLPASILKKRKHGFAVPTNLWLKGKLKDYLYEVLFDQKTRQRGYFNMDYVEKMYQEYQQGKPYHYQLWLLLNFELWHRRFIDNN
ncbi:asparagine synthase (glutamine-hydrolyzing) [Candidatus Parcubacteria bacterium]|nr:asparagine synthase (glutamine-hydrolyzing) [Candidatus Parcubacteria bacterium]